MRREVVGRHQGLDGPRAHLGADVTKQSFLRIVATLGLTILVWAGITSIVIGVLALMGDARGFPEHYRLLVGLYLIGGILFSIGAQGLQE